MALPLREVVTVAEMQQYVTEAYAAAKKFCPGSANVYAGFLQLINSTIQNEGLPPGEVVHVSSWKDQLINQIRPPCAAEKAQRAPAAPPTVATHDVPSVTVTKITPTPGSVPIKKAGFPWWIVLLLAGGAAYLYYTRKKKGKKKPAAAKGNPRRRRRRRRRRR